MFGPTALDVERVYRAAGVEPEGAERPDHASVELAFVGWLFEQAAADPAAGWQKLARRFIEVHAGRWLPQVGQSLAATGDPVYASIGQLLSGWLAEAAAAPRPKRKAGASLPAVPRPQACTLCGFCVRVCPTGALLIRETERETGLILNPAACIACGKCERVCEFDALRMTSPKTPAQEAVALRVSPRPPCPHCGAPTVSAAELDAVAAYLGRRPAWLDYCLNCRPQFMKG
ncbi:MAG: 4Fe-4S dicluster domain-containing protein [Anaerolineae bacterium]